MPGEAGVTVVTNVRVLYPTRAAAGASSARHSLRPLVFRGRFPAKLGHNLLARSRSHVWERHRCNTVDNSPNTRADIRVPERYISAARHVRAFGVWIGIAVMTGSTRSSGGLDDRRKRLLFRCWHRGTREMDLILGRFADAEIASLGDNEVAQFERLIEVPDPDLYAALTGDKALAPEYANRLFDRIKSFRADNDA
jgi:antitoxin CptB